jgi:chorismate mutase/prephenate dehydratase
MTSRQVDEALLQAKRDEINALDQELMAVLQRRAGVALDIGRLKQKLDLPLHDAVREQTVSEKIAAHKGGVLPGTALKAIWVEIMKACRGLQETVLLSKR